MMRKLRLTCMYLMHDTTNTHTHARLQVRIQVRIDYRLQAFATY